MKTKNYLLKAIAAVSILTVMSSCAKVIEPEVIPAEQSAGTGQGKTYTLTVKADKGDGKTRALELDGKTLTASWKEGEEVSVYKGDDKIGTLTAQSSGTSTMLKGTITGTLAQGDNLVLKFCSPDYASQEGTLDYIAANCDYATAEVAVTSIDETAGTLSIGDATFVSQQAVVQFTLKWNTGEPVSEGVDQLTIQAGETMKITVTPNPQSSVLFVAMPAMDKADIVMTALYGNAEFCYNKKDATFVAGKYYEIGVNMSYVFLIPDEQTLRYFLASLEDLYDGANGRLTRNITYSGNPSAPEVRSNKTIDLNGGTISGNNFSRIFSVTEGAKLTLTGGGTIKEGKDENGGAIYVQGGTLIIDDVTISGNQASMDGGGIHMEGGTLIMTGGTISGNSATRNCGGVNLTNGANMTMSGGSIENNSAENNDGGIYVGSASTLTMTGGRITGNTTTAAARGAGISVSGTLKMSGDPKVYGNTAHGTENNVFLNTGKTIMVTGPFDTGAHVGVDVASMGVFTNGFGAFNPGDFFPFFAGSNVYFMELDGGEGWISYAYYEASWNESTREVEYTRRPVPYGVGVENICSSKYTAGGTLNSQNWYVADGTAKIGTEGDVKCGGGVIHLVLFDGADVTTLGLYVDSGSTLHIHSQSYGDKMGKLTSIIGGGDPGIGGSGSMGTLIIHGGDITATGGWSGGAGIGGGKGHSNGPISIYGGNVTATGRGLAAGIGGGREASQGGAINIYGGSVRATGSWAAGYDVPGWGGAGIGGGSEGKGGSVNIFGGDVSVDAVDGGAGIGGGATKSGGTTCISGGTVLVTCQQNDGAGIGGGRDANCGTVKITGGNVQIIARGKAAIGTGDESTTADITITGGTVDMKRDVDHSPSWPIIGNDPLYPSKVTFVLGDYMKVETTPGQPVSTGSRESTCLAERQKALRISECDHHFDSDGQCLWCRYHR